MDSSEEGDITVGGGLYVEMDADTHEQYEENFADFMSDIQSHVQKLAAESSRAPQDAYEAFQGALPMPWLWLFVWLIDWLIE